MSRMVYLVAITTLLSFQAWSAADFIAEAKQKTEWIFKKIIEHPFLVELAQGTLSKDAFDRFLEQDIIYTYRYADALILLAEKTILLDEKLFLLNAANNSIHESSGRFPEGLEPCPTCQAYSDFELAMSQKSYCLGMAAIAPCYVVYAKIGDWLLNHIVPHNPYRDWIQSFANSKFQEKVRSLEFFMNRAAETFPQEYQAMLAAYEKSVRYEWQFWNSNYYASHWEPGQKDP